MADKLWKVFERWTGKNIFDGLKRNMGSGSINRTDEGEGRTGDVISSLYEIECKLRKKISIFRWWEKLEGESKASGKIPVLVMRETGNVKDTLIVIHWEYYRKLRRLHEKEGTVGECD